MCYEHRSIYASVCTCGQVAAQDGECYMSVEAGNPLQVQVAPTPSYVGQTLTLNLLLNPLWPTLLTDVPIDVKLVKYVDPLTSCLNEAAFSTPDGVLVSQNTTLYTFTFKHNYLLPPSSLLVCVRTALTPPVLISSSSSSSLSLLSNDNNINNDIKDDKDDITSTYSRVGLFPPNT